MTTTAASNLPRSGAVLRITTAASVQFREPFFYRVIRVHDWDTPDGWTWLDGYQLDSSGDAVERRSIFVQLRGLRGVEERTFPGRPPAARSTRGRPGADNGPAGPIL